MALSIDYDGKIHTLDLDAISLSEARYIKNATGYSPGNILNGLKELDPEAVAACFWLMKKQSGGKVMDIARLDFPLVQFADVLVDAVLADEDEDEEAPAAPKE